MPITEAECRRFLENPGINPKTGRKLVFGKGPYREYVRTCQRYNLSTEHLNNLNPGISSRNVSPEISTQSSSSSSSSSSNSSNSPQVVLPAMTTSSPSVGGRARSPRTETVRPPMVNPEDLLPQNAIISPTTGVPKIPPPNVDVKIEEREIEESEELLKYIPQIPPLATVLPSDPPLPIVFVNTRKQGNIESLMADLHLHESNEKTPTVVPVIPTVPQSKNKIPVIPFRNG